MTTTEAPLTITSLEVESIKRVRVARISPDGSLVVLGGRNAQGKSSVLDAIEMLLGGKGAIPPEPVHRGERRGKIVAELGDELVVERRFNATSGTSELEVRGKDGVPKRSPQGILDALCSAVTFDPLEFSRMPPKKQDEVLKGLLKLDFRVLDEKREAAFEERKSVNKRVKELDARAGALPIHKDVPAEEVSIAELTRQLQTANEHLRARDKAKDAVAALAGNIEDQRREVERMERELAAARSKLQTLEDQHALKQRALADLAPAQDTTALEQQIARADETNRKVRANAERKALQRKAEKLTDTIADIDAEKARQLAEAKFPVPGLGFDETGPTLNGLPLEQASQAEKLRLSVAIGFAMNPRLKVLLVREGSNLDSAGLRLLAELAEEYDGQVWLERVSEDGAGCSVVLEDGEARSVGRDAAE